MQAQKPNSYPDEKDRALVLKRPVLDVGRNSYVSSILLVFCFVYQLYSSQKPRQDLMGLSSAEIHSFQQNSECILPFPVGKTYTFIPGYVGRTYHSQPQLPMAAEERSEYS